MYKSFIPLLLLIAISPFSKSQTPILVKDINPGSDHGRPFTMIVYNDLLYFGAADTLYNHELWVSDGTESGTQLFKEIYPGPDHMGGPAIYTNLNGKLYFRAGEENYTATLYETDGTPDGTKLVKDSLYPKFIDHYIEVLNGKMYFNARLGFQDEELWVSDGTSSGTYVLKDINPGEDGSNPTHIKSLDGLLYFYADDGTHGYEPWVSDGTSDGTFMLKDINPGADGSAEFFGFRFARYLDRTYFIAYDTSHGTELWITDGSSDGTVLLKDIQPGPGSAFEVSRHYKFHEYQDQLYFRANDGPHGDELWKTNGTTEGTVLAEDIMPGVSGSHPVDFLVSNDKLYFSAYTPDHGMELCVKNGSQGTTTMVKDINPGEESGGAPFLSEFGNKLFFTGYDGTNGIEVWTSDGTNEGTQKLVPLNGTNYNPLGDVSFFGFYYYEGFIYFGANYDDKGKELYKLEVSTVGIKPAIENDIWINVYPNPSNGTFTVDIPKGYEDGVFHLYDLQGRLIDSYQYNNLRKLSRNLELQKGIYLLIIQSGVHSISGKLIIMD